MPIRFEANPFLKPSPLYGPDQRAALDPDCAARAREDLRSWPVYAPTPLVEASGLARHLGLGGVWIKHEAERKPLKSFKALGGAYALGEFLRDRIEAERGERPSYDQLFCGAYREEAKGFRVVATTDGNHGRSLAWGAKLLGVECSIFIPKNVTEDRAQPIRELGAEVMRIDANYDETMAHCAREAERNGWIHLQDTSYKGFTTAHKRIMEGYTLMMDEAFTQLPPRCRLTHSFLQVGCGGMAAAIIAAFWQRGAQQIPRTVLVQSEHVAPLVDTFAVGSRQIDRGSHDTLMVGIACGEVAMLAEQLLYPAAEGAMTISDESAIELMRLCATGIDGDPPLVVGETGAAGLAALKTACDDRNLRHRLDLDGRAQVLVINSEGDTAPAVYESVTAGPENPRIRCGG